jgi:large subunit ribosomal protein L3
MRVLLAKKVGMTQIFDDNGKRSGVTVLEVGPCIVTTIKTVEANGYNAVQIGYGEAKNISKSVAGQLKKSGARSAVLCEVRMPEMVAETEANSTSLKVGDELKVDQFKVGDRVIISGISKGKGFAGTIKRHNFHRGPKTHGSHNYRAPGSIGSGYPQRVFKGIKMAGRMGHSKVTIKNQRIAMIDTDKNLLAVVGSVPGPRKGIVMIQSCDVTPKEGEA